MSASIMLKNCISPKKIYEVLDRDGDVVYFGTAQGMRKYFGIAQSTLSKVVSNAVKKGESYRGCDIKESTYTSLIIDTEGVYHEPKTFNHDKLTWRLQTAKYMYTDLFLVYPKEGLPYIIDEDLVVVDNIKSFEGGCLV